MKKIIYTLMAITFIIIGLKILDTGIRKHEIAECMQWQKQKESIGDIWYATKWQETQCLEVANIDLSK